MMTPHIIGRMMSSAVVPVFFIDPATTEIYTLSLHDALPIYQDSLPAMRTRCLERLAGLPQALRNLHTTLQAPVGLSDRLRDLRDQMYRASATDIVAEARGRVDTPTMARRGRAKKKTRRQSS